MKRIKDLWPQIIAWQNLHEAYRRARRGKQDRYDVACFSFNLEPELRSLQQQLVSGTYQPGEYTQHLIYDRKPRTISVAPFRDRVLQQALMGVVEPALDRRFIDDSYACRVGKGAHAAVDRYQRYAQRYPYVLKLDIASYFPSIDHQRLKQKLAAMIGDAKVLDLFDRIIDSAPLSPIHIPDFPGDDLVDRMRPRGLPIGNLTSQFLGNLYLNKLDHLIKDQWREKAYLRYVDDLVILGDSKQHLWQVGQALREFLRGERLHIHAKKYWLQPSRCGVEFLGYRVWPYRRRLRADNGYKFRRRLKKMTQDYARGNLSLAQARPPIASWLGHAQHGETRQLCFALFNQHVFTRGNSPAPVCSSRRCLEQYSAEPAFCQSQQEQHR